MVAEHGLTGRFFSEMSSEIVSGITDEGYKFHQKIINGVQIRVQENLLGLWDACRFERELVWHRMFVSEQQAIFWLNSHTECDWGNKMDESSKRTAKSSLDASPKARDWEAIDRFRAMGYAVVILSPGEFEGLCKNELENHVANCASDFIEEMAEEAQGESEFSNE